MPTTSSAPASVPIFNSRDWPWWLVYLLLLAATAYGMLALRSWTLQTYDNDAASSEWQEWKEQATDMSQQSGPVKRKAPTSMEPPGLRLARDYFLACFAGGFCLAAVLLGVFLLMIRGALATPNHPIRHDVKSD